MQQFEKDNKNLSVIIVAAGTGSRMKSAEHKQFLTLKSRPMLAVTMEIFERHSSVQEIIVVSHPNEVERVQQDIIDREDFLKITHLVPGGSSRIESVKAGLSALSENSNYVAVHDGARPLTSPDILDRVFCRAMEKGAAIPGMPVSDTVKRGNGEGVIEETIPRERLWAVQTPQVFRKDWLLDAYRRLPQKATATDDASVLELAGYQVHLVPGSDENIKITLPEDLRKAALILEGRRSRMRIGNGFDVHALVPNRKLIIGGVHIPHEKGLAGHSDADVLTHAIMDALLGAAGLGDIGRHFPDSAEIYRGISSLRLLEKVIGLLQEKALVIEHIDAVIIAQEPRMMPFMEEMKKCLSMTMAIGVEQINLKATTTENLGFIGRKEGIAAQAVVLMSGSAAGQEKGIMAD